MKKILSRLIVVLIISSISLTLVKVRVLEARDFESGKILENWMIKNDEFTIFYTHSVMLSRVTETYDLKGSSILLKESTFKDYGAGLPSSTPYDFSYDKENKLFRIYNINQEISPLVYKVASERADQKISINGQIRPFRNFSREKTSVEFKINKVCLLRYLLNRGGN